MIDMSKITDHMEVVGSDGQHVGTIDSVDTTRLKLTKQDPAAGGQHRYLPFSAIARVDGNQVHLSIPAAEARGMTETRGSDPV
ncbi:DUF2171 domain-containing protein [Belnapia rosea]|uniref:DUF2171 domain-containing protein n=1 Tax=Belnapia rosea TaxID=938405 RepID=A0A1G7CDH4_9PROT|nr:DUF2171 domain-containing protein [Belnapia rosea]SDB71254.1 hypothetical protein SAMN02927895_04052 [Belnapia rosea]SDE36455.1 hypothetical protein SAMN04487779_103034 [Belnapia rosea]